MTGNAKITRWSHKTLLIIEEEKLIKRKGSINCFGEDERGNSQLRNPPPPHTKPFPPPPTHTAASTSGFPHYSPPPQREVERRTDIFGFGKDKISI